MLEMWKPGLRDVKKFAQFSRLVSGRTRFERKT